ncbi:MAG TPA: tail protein X [Candidatus Saccharimonadales bacterium]|nr:tail protein X [Candidatus Saccharimonadales bacterium]
MAVTGYELVQITGDGVTADLIIWRRYRRPAPGILEIMLDSNPQLAYVHRYTPFIPPGTYVRIPIDPDILAGKPTSSQMTNVWSNG